MKILLQWFSQMFSFVEFEKLLLKKLEIGGRKMVPNQIFYCFIYSIHKLSANKPGSEFVYNFLVLMNEKGFTNCFVSKRTSMRCDKLSCIGSHSSAAVFVAGIDRIHRATFELLEIAIHLSSTNQACFLQYKFWTFVIFLQVLDRED
jgi:hypothetical protein